MDEHPKLTVLKLGHAKNFQNLEITGKDSNMFKATEFERKIREINLLIDTQINLFL